MYKCVLCKTPSEVIVKGSTLESTKCKCPKCGMMFQAADSVALAKSSKEPNANDTGTEAPSSAADQESQVRNEVRHTAAGITNPYEGERTRLPRTLAYVIVSKDRTRHEFVNKKQLKKAVLQWETREKPYEVFELSPKSVQAKVDIS